MSETVLTTAITTLGLIIVAIIGTFSGREIVRRTKAKRQREVEVEEREAVEAFNNDPGQWVKDVLGNAKELAAEVRELRKEVRDLHKAHEERDRRERNFLAAIARWIVDIARAWGSQPEMPYPREEDREILAEVIPVMVEATRPRRRHSTEGKTSPA